MIKERTIICEASTLSWVGRGRVPLIVHQVQIPPLPSPKMMLFCAASFPFFVKSSHRPSDYKTTLHSSSNFKE